MGWAETVEDALTALPGAAPPVVLLLGPGGAGKTHFWERWLPERGWEVVAREDVEGAVSLGDWLDRAAGSPFGFCSRRPVVVVDGVEALSSAERAALLAFVRRRSVAAAASTLAAASAGPGPGGRPVLLIGRECGRDLELACTQTVPAPRISDLQVAAAALAATVPRLPRATLLACVRRALAGQEDDECGRGLGVDMNRASALARAEAIAPGLGTRVSGPRDAAGGCPDAERLLASPDALAPDVLERRIGGDAAVAFSLVFENVDALLARVYASGRARKRDAVRDALVRACAAMEPIQHGAFMVRGEGREILTDCLSTALRAVLGGVPRRVRCAPGAPPFAAAGLWSRGATAAQAALRRADVAAAEGMSLLVVRAAATAEVRQLKPTTRVRDARRA